jgi:anti-sigma B factor antagonist
MSIEIKEQGQISIIKLSGNIMGGPEASEINERIHVLIDAGKRKIIIDLKDVELMNSSGLGILISAVTTLKNNEGELALTSLSNRIENLLTITKLKNIFTIFSDIETALKELS